MKNNPGIGATAELSLRVSVAALVRVIFNHPTNGETILALERKATLHKEKVEVRSQPFGGAIRIHNLTAIRDLIGDFHFDSERSRSERDFRIFIRPSTWSVLREFCLQNIDRDDDSIFETNPGRELAEEFSDALKINLQPDQYISKPMATIVEDEAAPTKNIHARGISTVRIYRIFEVNIMDSSLAPAMLINSETISDKELCTLALDDFQKGGRGRANAMLVLPLKKITDHYSAMPPEKRNVPNYFEKNLLSETVPIVIDGISVPKYQRI